MNELRIFESQEFGQVRTAEVNGKAYFFGVDIAAALEYARPSKAVSDHCKGILTQDTIKNSGGYPEKLIPEGDVYRLIVKASEQSTNPNIKEKAERFASWIFDEVLPSIRQTGGYVSNDDLFIQTYLPYADEATKQMFKQTLYVIRQQNEQIQIMKPKAEYFDELVDRNLLTNFRDTAKELKVPQNQFIQFLLDSKYVYRDSKGNLMPYAQYVDKLFEVKDYTNKKTGHVGVQTLIRGKGGKK